MRVSTSTRAALAVSRSRSSVDHLLRAPGWPRPRRGRALRPGWPARSPRSAARASASRTSALLHDELLAQGRQLLAPRPRRSRPASSRSRRPYSICPSQSLMSLRRPSSASLPWLSTRSHSVQLDALVLEGELALGDAGLEAAVSASRSPTSRRVRTLDLLHQIAAVVRARWRARGRADRLAQALVARGLLRLALDRGDLAADLAEHVGHAQQVLLGGGLIFDSASRRRALYLPMPAASSMSARRSSALAETISATRPCSTIV